ncbi:MAG: hypothetical protein M3552_13395 [Planctomycetota bacterium]|nr:hypothetical protein [Planctomycetaceae bacterium]MDQ3331627.1 hypothetical protein [Planctomycetota bacterium]
MTAVSQLRGALKNAFLLTACLAVGWLVLAALAWAASRPNVLTELSIAATLCLIPGWLVFGIHSRYGTAAPLAVFLIATAGRMAAVLVGALAVQSARPDLDMKAFALFLGAFYVLSLAIETKLLLKSPAGSTSTDD